MYAAAMRIRETKLKTLTGQVMREKERDRKGTINTFYFVHKMEVIIVFSSFSNRNHFSETYLVDNWIGLYNDDRFKHAFSIMCYCWNMCLLLSAKKNTVVFVLSGVW